MNRVPWRRARGIKQITRGLGTLDQELFDAIAETDTPLLDTVMPPLTRAADHSKLWVAIGAALLAAGRPSAQRGATRGLVTLAAASLVTNQIAKRIRPRPRPSYDLVPLVRQVRRRPTSNSLPSGHSASAAAFAVGVGLENPPVGFGLALLAGLVGLSRVVVGAHFIDHPGPGATARLRVDDQHHAGSVGPLRRRDAKRFGSRKRGFDDRRDKPATQHGQARPDPESGDHVAGVVRAELPKVDIRELGPDDDPMKVLRSAAERAEVLAVGGGDGTVAAAAGVAIDAGLPLAVFPAGTFNHFAKDIGCDTVAATAEAIRRGHVAYVDLVCLNESHMVLNTASIGAYPTFVQQREKLEKRIGKPLAGLYAMLHTLRKDEPVRICYDNKTLLTSLFFLGNSLYLPTGFAPSRRTRMDDGLIDVRILETGRRFARTRILIALALGRLERSPLYHELQVPEFSFSAVDGPTIIACDGEVGDQYDQASFSAKYRALPVFRPLPD
ncbi:bifunctional phosphatase PAP2/diacylglycerol kinase family protein [Mycobacterium sp. 1465703.0]|uniref:bifunctional phosphatase PAP2/diacylglycerol kinase family protein n=1 Tax=Mycobacterium sp. 1465703.0 TaxID=1834078 RepID=UPI0008000D0E|nr:bifunctional phosphatase PAP2/diacylglycerol kinase family protein [Mycobacterium sp. 1465703.0]OBI97179.1 phosphoesterase [Mycobacterium sp. 1465703.0]